MSVSREAIQATVKDTLPHELPDTLEEFKEWVETFSDKQSVGRARIDYECPIAQYLNWKYSHTGRKYTVAVCTARVETSLGLKSWIPMPKWMQKFVEAVDTQVEYNDPISKEIALLTIKFVEANL